MLNVSKHEKAKDPQSAKIKICFCSSLSRAHHHITLYAVRSLKVVPKASGLFLP